MSKAGMTALAVAFPRTIRTNDYWREHHPELVRTAHEHALAQLWARDERVSTFERAMAPYATDPFKGSRERRVLADDETALDLEAAAVDRAVEAWGGAIDDIDLLVVGSMRPDSLAVGDAAWLARRLGLSCPAVNLETACSSSLVAFDWACALVDSGRHRRVLVVACCTYSRDIDEGNSLAWFLADGAGAFVVERSSRAAVPIGTKLISTAETCGAFVHELTVVEGRPAMQMRATRGAGKVLHDTAEPYLRECCHGALDAAGVSLADVSLFVFNTPTAWYADFGADVLGVDRARALSTYPIYTNVGPALMPVNLHHAALGGRLRANDLVLAYAVGSASTATAVVVRWGDVRLGRAPAPPRTVAQDETLATSTE